MPTPMLQSMAARSGKSMAEVEKMWDEAKSQAKDKSDVKDFYAYTTGILKKMLNLEESSATVEETSAVKVSGRKYASIYEVPNIWVLNIVSNVIEEAAYDPSTATLYLNFKSGSVNDWYAYLKVPIKVFTEFTLADSKGIYFSKKIRGVYEGGKLPSTK